MGSPRAAPSHSPEKQIDALAGPKGISQTPPPRPPPSRTRLPIRIPVSTLPSVLEFRVKDQRQANVQLPPFAVEHMQAVVSQSQAGPESRVMDVGAGTGILLRFLQEAGVQQVNSGGVGSAGRDCIGLFCRRKRRTI